MTERERARWVELANQDPTAVSTRFVLDLNWLDAARYVFDRNFTETVQLADAVENNVEFIVKANRQQEDAVHREFVRRFHNYVASAKTMVDNTRAVRVRWETPDFCRLCEERIEDAQEASREIPPGNAKRDAPFAATPNSPRNHASTGSSRTSYSNAAAAPDG